MKTVVVFKAGEPLSLFSGQDADVDLCLGHYTGDDIATRDVKGTRWENCASLSSIPSLRYFDIGWRPPQ